MLGVKAYAIVAALLFGLGVYGALVRKHAVAVLVALELMLNGAMLAFASFSLLQPMAQAVSGQAFVIFIIAVAAAEMIVGLALVLALHRVFRTARLDSFELLKW
jgi:NADH:ubiquinone oxidoreductase subunit K